MGITATAAWMGAEGLVQYGKARQRLGLCDPLTRNRFLLWGLASTLWTALQFVFVAQSIEYAASQQWSAPIDALVGAIEITAIAMIWLAFFPPARYRRWVASAGLTAAES